MNSSYMSFQNQHPHGKAPVNRTFDHAVFKSHEKAMMMLREKSWEPEKARLISHGATSLVYEDIKDLSSTEILNKDLTKKLNPLPVRFLLAGVPITLPLNLEPEIQIFS